MYIGDVMDWATVFGLGLFFTVEWLNFPLKASSGSQVAAGVLSAYVRIVIFPFLAGACWFIMAGFSAALNNCVAAFATCFTSPTFNTGTLVITVDPAGTVMYYLFYGLFWSFMVTGLVSAIYFALKPIMPELPGERAPV